MLKKLFRNKRSVFCLLTFVLACSFLWTGAALAAPSADLWPRWQASVENSTQVIDHSPWGAILTKYLVTNHPSGINRFKYKAVTKEDRQSLDNYLLQLQQTKVSQLNRAEQKSFWVNLYNATTVKVILDHYLVKSIMKIGISPGFFSKGPWGAKLLTIEGEQLGLNDIEHRILRPIFKDNRIHYAVNCASLGCPNLQPEPFTAKNMDQMLDAAARAYINHPNGVRIDGGKIIVSSIYDWFQADFGDSEQGVIKHLLLYAKDDLAGTLRAYKGKLGFDYNWNLNEL